MSERRARLARALPYVVAGIAAAYLYYLALNFGFHRRPGTLGPDAWPAGISLLMLAVCVYKAAEALLRRRMPLTPYEEIATPEPPPSAPQEHHPWLLVLGMLVTLAYVALVTQVGFFICTAAYLATFLWLGGYRRTGAVAALSLLGTAALMLVFMKLVYISLPIGRPPFSGVMIGLMQLMGIR